MNEQKYNRIMIKYNELDKHFVELKTNSPYDGITKIPRKLKKKIQKWAGVHWVNGTSVEAKLWFYLGHKNPNYKRFLIKKICDNYGK